MPNAPKMEKLINHIYIQIIGIWNRLLQKKDINFTKYFHLFIEIVVCTYWCIHQKLNNNLILIMVLF